MPLSIFVYLRRNLLHWHIVLLTYYHITIIIMSVFTKIISGEIPAYKIREDKQFLAFLDIAPLREGHVLVIPKLAIDNLFDLPAEYLGNMLLFAQPVARAIEKTFRCNRCGITVIGLEVPHAHMHLIPINSANDLNFTQSKLKVTQAQLQNTQQRILQHLEGNAQTVN